MSPISWKGAASLFAILSSEKRKEKVKEKTKLIHLSFLPPSKRLNNFAVGLSTPDFITAAPYGVYIFLGLICFLSVAYVHFLVPETKGRTLDELDELFGDQSGRSKMETAMLLQAQKDVGLLDFADLRNVAGIPQSESPMPEEKEDLYKTTYDA